jgi:hypothetical protein
MGRLHHLLRASSRCTARSRLAGQRRAEQHAHPAIVVLEGELHVAAVGEAEASGVRQREAPADHLADEQFRHRRAGAGIRGREPLADRLHPARGVVERSRDDLGEQAPVKDERVGQEHAEQVIEPVDLRLRV